MSEIETLKKIKEMAQIAATTGRISTIQEKNLKMYPLVFFDGVKEVEIEYDLSPFQASSNGYDVVCKSKSFVIYKISTDGREIEDLDRRGKAITDAVHVLLWSGIVVEVIIDGVTKYRGE